jgi:hypothetical protein
MADPLSMSTLPDTPEVRAVIKTVVERVTARMERGEAPPARVVPRSKDAVPKILCLDQNKWVDLARAHYGREEGKPFVDALAAIRAAVERNTLMVPIMPSNLIEVAEPNDQGRRERTAQFMVDLSGNHSFSKPEPVADLEMNHAIRSVFLGEQVDPFPREKLVAWGIEFALGRRMVGPEFLVQALNEPEASVLALVHAVGRDGVAEGRRLDERAAEAARVARGRGDRSARVGEELTALFGSGSFATRLYGQVEYLGIEHKLFARWLEGNQERFAAGMPNVDVELRLLLARDQNQHHATHRNDLKDFIFLKLAIPYGNMVVTENSWAHLARAEKMDLQYGTTVMADLRDLPTLLAREGCLG